jgi:hypothetical protein
MARPRLRARAWAAPALSGRGPVPDRTSAVAERAALARAGNRHAAKAGRAEDGTATHRPAMGPGHRPPCPHRGRGWPPRQRLGRAAARHGRATAPAPGPGSRAPPAPGPGSRTPWPGHRARASAGQPHTPRAMAGRRACAAGARHRARAWPPWPPLLAGPPAGEPGLGAARAWLRLGPPQPRRTSPRPLALGLPAPPPGDHAYAHLGHRARHREPPPGVAGYCGKGMSS